MIKTKEEREEKLKRMITDLLSVKITEMIESLCYKPLNQYILENKDKFPKINSWYGMYLKRINSNKCPNAYNELIDTVDKECPITRMYGQYMYLLFYLGKYGVEKVLVTQTFTDFTLKDSVVDKDIKPLKDQKGNMAELIIEGIFPSGFLDVFSQGQMIRVTEIEYLHKNDCVYLEFRLFGKDREICEPEQKGSKMILSRIYQPEMVLETWEAIENEQNWDYIQ